MSQVLTRAEWNSIIDQINALLTNPPVGCGAAISPLSRADPNHIWTKTDIHKVQNALTNLCPKSLFDPIPDLWKQKTYDDILAALALGWCNCCDKSKSGAGTIVQVASIAGRPVIGGYQFVSGGGCAAVEGYPCPGYTPMSYQSPASLVQGLQVAPPGFTNRQWSLYGTYSKTGSPPENYGAVGSGIISCDGVIRDANDSLTVPMWYATSVQCCYCNWGVTTFFDPSPTGYTALRFYVQVLNTNNTGCCKP